MFNIKNLLNKKAKECWEFKKCDEELRDKCPAYTEDMGMECWEVEGTLCEGSSHDEFSKKLKDCSTCDYYLIAAWGLEPTESHKKYVKEALSKARAKKAKLSIEKILDKCVRRFKEAATVKNITIELSIPDRNKNVLEFFGNQQEVTHVFLHFIAKSLTYSKPDTTLYLRADNMDEHIQIGIIYTSMINGPLLYEEDSDDQPENSEIIAEEVIAHHEGRCWEEINPSGRSGLFFTFAKDRRAVHKKTHSDSNSNSIDQDRRIE